jgi:hypothetical protein
MKERNAIGDAVRASGGYRRKPTEELGAVGHGRYVLRGPDGQIKQEGEFRNLITQAGDQIIMERFAGIGSHALPSGMKLGTGTTTPSKTGAGSHIVTYKSGSHRPFESGFPTSSKPATARRITYEALWAAGVATQDGLSEVIITNQDPLADNAGSGANTLSRALLSPVVNKGADDTLTVTWHYDAEGV